MKTVALSVPESVLGSIKSGDSVVLKSGRKSVTLKVVPSSAWIRPTKAILRAFCEQANKRDTRAERGLMESIFPW
ncbi:MAG: hypothetical protein ABL892_13670 [Thiobacillaceae bacterium]